MWSVLMEIHFFLENLKMSFENSHGKDSAVKLSSPYDPRFLNAFNLFFGLCQVMLTEWKVITNLELSILARAAVGKRFN